MAKRDTAFWVRIANYRNKRVSNGLSDRSYILHYSQPEPNSGCWLWLGPVNNTGYGIGRKRDGTRLAPRLSYIAFKDLISKGMVVCHKCDTPLCVNPDHLFLGSMADNVMDAHVKKRHCYGEAHPLAKLTENDVAYIRSSSESQRTLSKKFGVNQSGINRIRHLKTWKTNRDPSDISM
jgi:hypothetical protein